MSNLKLAKINTSYANAAKSITPQMSGTTFVCTRPAADANAYILTLPSSTIAGLTYRFTYPTDSAAVGAGRSVTITTPDAAELLYGLKNFHANITAVTAARTVILSGLATGAAYVDLISDGSNWRVNSSAIGTDHITYA